MHPRSTHRRVAVAALGLVLAVVVAACAPMPPPPPNPTARAAATPTPPGYFGLPVAFSSAGSKDPDGGAIVSYLWEFGVPGQTSTDPNPTFTYREPGTYSVKLTVTDDEGDSNSRTIQVNQPAPPGDAFLLDNPVEVLDLPGATTTKFWWNNQTPNQLVFVDICRKPSSDPTFQPGLDCASLSSQTPNGTASGAGVIDVDIFRGPDPAGDLPWGCFAAGDTAPPGIEKNTTCYVRVTNNSLFNNTEAREVAFTIDGGPQPQDPVAAASATPQAPGFFGLPVAFSSAGSNDPDGGAIVSYLWEFGTPGGQTSTDPDPSFTYTQPGTYDVTLTVTDDEGAQDSVTIQVDQPAPLGDVVLSSNPVQVPAVNAATTVKVWWNNQTPDQLVYVDICRKVSTDPTFQPGLDCAPLSSQTPNGTLSGSGVLNVDVFRGQEPSGDLDWGCFAAGDTAPPGIQKNTTCYVRVTNSSLFNTAAARDAAFSIIP